jgi:hypothetical protein
MKSVVLQCVGGPEDGRLVEVEKSYGRCVSFPFRELGACTWQPINNEMPLEAPRFRTSEYMISWRTCTAYFDGVYG